VKAKVTDPAHQPVYIRCDEGVPFGSFATVADELQESGIRNISVVTVPITEKPAPATERTMGGKRPGEKLGNSLVWSGALHAALAVLFVVSAMLSHRGEMWGGSGEGEPVQVSLVGSMPAVPLPAPSTITTSRVVDTTHGLYKSQPPPKVPFEPQATKLPEFEKEKRPIWKSPRKSRILQNKAQPPPMRYLTDREDRRQFPTLPRRSRWVRIRPQA